MAIIEKAVPLSGSTNLNFKVVGSTNYPKPSGKNLFVTSLDIGNHSFSTSETFGSTTYTCTTRVIVNENHSMTLQTTVSSTTLDTIIDRVIVNLKSGTIYTLVGVDEANVVGKVALRVLEVENTEDKTEVVEIASTSDGSTTFVCPELSNTANTYAVSIELIGGKTTIYDADLLGSTIYPMLVVGSTAVDYEPCTWMDNTIWVKTDTAITDWAIGAENPYLEERTVEYLDNLTLGSGYLSTAGAVSTADATKKEVYIEEYIEVEYGKNYVVNYSVSSTQAMWLCICEYKTDKTFIQRLVPINASGTVKTHTYTPSANTVAYVRLSWRTFDMATCSFTYTGLFVKDDVPEGVVWVKTVENSSINFNALKKFGAMVHIAYAYQYLDGAWTSFKMLCFQNGVWQYRLLYLYNKGDLCTDTTGGWSTAKYKADHWYPSDITLSKKTDYLSIVTVSDDDNMQGAFFTTNTIDVTNFNKLYIDAKISSSNNQKTFRYGLYSSKPTSSSQGTRIKAGSSSTFTGVLELDISGIEGFYNIGFDIYKYSSWGTTKQYAYVYKVWME